MCWVTAVEQWEFRGVGLRVVARVQTTGERPYGCKVRGGLIPDLGTGRGPMAFAKAF